LAAASARTAAFLKALNITGVNNLQWLITRRYHTLIEEREKEGYPSKVSITKPRKEPLRGLLRQIFPERETVCCVDRLYA
jgi:hypothetical protein